MTIAMIAMVMLIVTAAASYLPARRAAQVDPMVALRIISYLKFQI